MDIANELVAALGVAWAAAVALEFLSIVVEGAAAPRKTADTGAEEGKGVASHLMMIASSLATVFLFVHVFFMSRIGDGPRVLFFGLGIVASIVLFGALIGGSVARLIPALRGPAGAIKLPLAMLAFAVTLYATLPSVALFLRAYLGIVLPI